MFVLFDVCGCALLFVVCMLHFVGVHGSLLLLVVVCCLLFVVVCLLLFDVLACFCRCLYIQFDVS